MNLNDTQTISSLALSLKRKIENEGLVRTRPVVKSIEHTNVLPYMLSIGLHYCYSCSVNKDLSLILCKKSIQQRFKDGFTIEDLYDYTKIQSSTLSTLKSFVDVFITSVSNDVNMQEVISSIPPRLVSSYRIDSFSITNKRHKQEDRYFAVTDLLNYCSLSVSDKKNNISAVCSDNGHPDRVNGNASPSPPTRQRNGSGVSCTVPVLGVGVMDGHNGPEVAEHSHHLAPFALSAHLQRGRSVLWSIGEVFHRLNREASEWKSGCTATVCIMEDDIVYTGWVGDSQAWIVYANGESLALTDTLHHPSDGVENVSVSHLGGDVSEDERVKGLLAVSRALGDGDKIPGVSPLPSTTAYRLRGAELCLVVASDGLWDSTCCEGESVAHFVKEWYQDNHHDPASRCSLPKLLVERAVQAGSSDNTTVVVVWLDEETRQQYMASTSQLASGSPPQQSTSILTNNGENSLSPPHPQQLIPVRPRGRLRLVDMRAVRYPHGRRRSCPPVDTDLVDTFNYQLDLDKRESWAYSRADSGGHRRVDSFPMGDVPIRFSSPTRIKEGPSGLLRE